MDKNTKLIISIFEGLYIMYMFIFFKTKYSLEIGRWVGNPITTFFQDKLHLDVKDLLDHPVVLCEEPMSQICLFGKYASILIFIFLVLRNFIPCLAKVNTVIFIIIFIMSFMNYNAVLYLIPVFLLELYLYKN